MGKSGSGKSTILSMMVNLLKPSSGKIFLNGKELETSDSLRFKKLVGYVSQDICLIEDSIMNNILLGSKNKKIDKNF